MKLWWKAIGIVLGGTFGIVGGLALFVWLWMINPVALGITMFSVVAVLVLSGMVVGVHSHLEDKQNPRRHERRNDGWNV